MSDKSKSVDVERPKTPAQLRLEEWFAREPRFLSAEEIIRRKAEKIRQQREEELQLAAEHNRKVLRLTPYGGPRGRKWRPYVDSASACVEHEPTAVDEAAEIREAVAKAARQARMRADPDGIGHYGANETMADIVRRQDETR
jgi:hypothetical protein